jgi:hypothetical protein
MYINPWDCGWQPPSTIALGPIVRLHSKAWLQPCVDAGILLHSPHAAISHVFLICLFELMCLIGHVFCTGCLNSSIGNEHRRSRDVTTASCPTCRKRYSLGMLGSSRSKLQTPLTSCAQVRLEETVVPAKYRPFLHQPIRRLYIDVQPDAGSMSAIEADAARAEIAELISTNRKAGTDLADLRNENEILRNSLRNTQSNHWERLDLQRENQRLRVSEQDLLRQLNQLRFFSLALPIAISVLCFLWTWKSSRGLDFIRFLYNLNVGGLMNKH